MQILNPKQPLLTAYADLLAVIGLPVYAKKIPKNVVPIPQQYILLTSQTLEQTAIGKYCFEWQTSIVIDVCYSNPSGYASPVQNMPIEQQIIQLVEDSLIIPGWIVKNTRFIQSTDLNTGIETATSSIDRVVITYQHWLWPSTT